jgi:hypothetical protein
MVFQNPDRLQYVPRSYFGTLPNGSDFRLPWDCRTVVWTNYYAGLRKFLQDNGVTNPPSEADVQNFMCSHVLQGCVGERRGYTHASSSGNQSRPSGTGCRGCGARF